jgi:hypothetical protein
MLSIGGHASLIEVLNAPILLPLCTQPSAQPLRQPLQSRPARWAGTLARPRPCRPRTPPAPAQRRPCWLALVNVPGRRRFPDSVLHIKDRTEHGELLRIGGAGQHHPQACGSGARYGATWSPDQMGHDVRPAHAADLCPLPALSLPFQLAGHLREADQSTDLPTTDRYQALQKTVQGGIHN